MKKYLAVLSLITLAAIGFSMHAPKTVQAQGQYAKCVSASASPACQQSNYGIATIAASAQTVVVNTTAVVANPVIALTYDASTTTGTALSVTCNTTAQLPYISAYTVGSSFTIRTGSTFTANPGCIQWRIISQ